MDCSTLLLEKVIPLIDNAEPLTRLAANLGLLIYSELKCNKQIAEKQEKELIQIKQELAKLRKQFFAVECAIEEDDVALIDQGCRFSSKSPAPKRRKLSSDEKNASKESNKFANYLSQLTKDTCAEKTLNDSKQTVKPPQLSANSAEKLNLPVFPQPKQEKQNQTSTEQNTSESIASQNILKNEKNVNQSSKLHKQNSPIQSGTKSSSPNMTSLDEPNFSQLFSDMGKFFKVSIQQKFLNDQIYKATLETQIRQSQAATSNQHKSGLKESIDTKPKLEKIQDFSNKTQMPQSLNSVPNKSPLSNFSFSNSSKTTIAKPEVKQSKSPISKSSGFVFPSTVKYVSENVMKPKEDFGSKRSQEQEKKNLEKLQKDNNPSNKSFLCVLCDQSYKMFKGGIVKHLIEVHRLPVAQNPDKQLRKFIKFLY